MAESLLEWIEEDVSPFRDRSIRWLSAVIIPLIVVWIFAAVYAGRRFRDATE